MDEKEKIFSYLNYVRVIARRYCKRLPPSVIQMAGGVDEYISEGFLALALRTYDREIGEQKPYISAAVRYALFAWTKRHIIRIKGIERIKRWLREKFSVIDDERLDREDLARNVRALPEAYRLAIEMHYLEQLSQDEVARRLNESPSMVRYRLRKGEALLAELYGDMSPLIELLAKTSGHYNKKRRARKRSAHSTAV